MKLGRRLRKAAMLLSRKSRSGKSRSEPVNLELTETLRAPNAASDENAVSAGAKHEGPYSELPRMETDTNSEIDRSSAPSVSHTQVLPNELLYCILGYLVSSLYPHAFTYQVHFPAFNYNQNLINHMDDGELHMLSAIQVCRIWHAIGTQLLYSAPMLISHRRIRLFAATLENSAYLSKYVRDVFVLDQALRPPYEHHPTREVHNAIAYRLARTDLIRALRLCPSLRSLTISNRPDAYTAMHPIDNFFLSTSLSSSRLQKLVIYGSMAPIFPNFRPFMSEDASMPNLQILCLREICFPDDFIFPYLPQLHTLRMAQCCLLREYPHDGSITISSDRLPSLRTLELYTNTFSVQLDDTGMRRLRRYHVFPYADFLSGQVDFAASASLCHLVLGRLASAYPDIAISKWQLPAALETLVLCLNIPAVYPQALFAQPDVFNSLCHCLDLRDRGRFLSLRKLTLRIHYGSIPPFFHMSAPGDLAAFKLEILCAARGIDCEVITNVTADEWITEQLTQDDFAT